MATTTDLNNENCPVCLTDKFLHKDLKLLVSPCFHKMCENCINRIFLSGPAPCPICKTTLRKNNFVIQTFEDLYVEKEVQIRKKVGRYFNKRGEDFVNLRAFNDYLEDAEDMIFNMINNVNVQETAERIEAFRFENKDLIATNLTKQLLEDKTTTNNLAREKKEKYLRQDAYLRQARAEIDRKHQDHESLINQLASADSENKVKEIVSETIAKRVALPALVPVIAVKLDDFQEHDIDTDMELDIDETNFGSALLEIVADKLTLQPSYSCGWTSSIIKESSLLLSASGYSATQTYQRALTSATDGLFFNIDV